MNGELIWVLVLLAVVMVLFATNKLRMDVVAILVIVVFVLSHTLTLQEALAGFSDPNVILIGSLFIIGEGLVRTGIAYQVGNWLMRVAGNSELKMMVLLMLTVSGLGAIISSTGVVAIFIPIVLSVCIKMKLPPSRLMMPLSFAGLISGMTTLIATPPNMVVHGELVRAGFKGFNFFSMTPIGMVILALGMGYMLVARHWLGGKSNNEDQERWNRRTMRDLIRAYKLTGSARRLTIRPGSPLIGRTLDEIHLRSRYGANVIGIERWRKFRRVMVNAFGSTELRVRDVLLIYLPDQDVDLRKFYAEEMLEPMVLRGDSFSERPQEVGMAEISLMPESSLTGKSIRQMAFRSTYGLNVVGIRRDGQPLEGMLVDEPIQLGDILLVVGDWRQIQQLQQKNHKFIVLDLPAEVDEMVPASSQAPHALFCLVLMVALMLTGEVPNAIAAIIACLLMGKFRCIDMESAYNAIHWPSLILIIGMLPFALALQKTGGVALIVQGLMDLVGDMGPRVVLLSLFILCAAIGLFISNTATAVLMAPIGIAAAQEMHVSPVPFAMVIVIAASAAFMTPVSSPVNTLVLAPGGYKFADFVRIGVPFTLLIMVVSVFLIPLIFPF